jgi:hypothetical protein
MEAPAIDDTGRSAAPILITFNPSCLTPASTMIVIKLESSAGQIRARFQLPKVVIIIVSHPWPSVIFFAHPILCRYRHQALFSRHRTINNTFHYSSTTLSTANTTTVLQEGRRRSTNLFYSSPDLNRPSGYLLSV